MRILEIPKHHLVAGLLIGLLSGLAATGFHYLAYVFGQILFSWVETNSLPMRLPLVILVPTIGLFLVGLVLQYYPEGTHGGVREVYESLDSRDPLIPYSRIVNVILSGFVLAFGGSVGPEGPMVQMGALIGSKVGEHFTAHLPSRKMLVRAGAAAGIAAAFRSPAGGIWLALETLGAQFNTELPIIGISAAIGYLTRVVLLGKDDSMTLPYVPKPVPLAGLLLVAPMMGIAAAPLGHLFIRMYQFLKENFPKRIPRSLRVGLGGFLVGCIGIFYPQVMSAGYAVVESALHGRLDLKLLAILLALKMIATAISFGSGAVGGLFAPTLFIGAMFGGVFGYGFHALYPAAVPQPEVFILLGMVVMFGSIIKGYWSGLLLVADMSGTYHAILLPGIIAGGISFLISWKLHDRSIFDLPLPAEHRAAQGMDRSQGASGPKSASLDKVDVGRDDK
ncbi:MAG TPA: chloride channel protein [Acidobacteriota bacterium]|nr:chloride channel protein [Acidobacteriota bacterium]